MSTPTNTHQSGPITLVNVFTANPGQQPQLAQLLTDGSREFFSQQPGFIASSVIAAATGEKLVNISQWSSAEDVAAFRNDSRFPDYMKSILALGHAESLMGTTVFHTAKPGQ
jgi:heme-degrading monooxygenase HmoA